MLEKNVTTTGKIFTHIDNLKTWDKNPRSIDEAGDLRLRIQIATLGQYKPLLVTEDGLIVGGNMRLREFVWLNTHVLEYTDAKGQKHEIDKRNQFNNVWITELSFAQNQETGKYQALIDGKAQEKQYETIEQIMIEYALSDNDTVGKYEQKQLHQLIAPYQEMIQLENYKLELQPAVPLKMFMMHPEKIKDGNEEKKSDEGKNKIVVMKFEFTPEAYKSVEPRVQKIRDALGVENNADLLTNLLAMAEEIKAKEEAEDTTTADVPQQGTTETPAETSTPQDPQV